MSKVSIPTTCFERVTEVLPYRLSVGLIVFVERLQGLDFEWRVEAEEAGLDPSHARWSSPSGNKYLRAVLNDLAISENDAIIDVGCGKGSAMRTMLMFPFSRVAGIELSRRMVEIARQNFKKLRQLSNRCVVTLSDASEFTDYDLFNHIYFYNPFGSTTMSRVVNNLTRSIERNPRKVFVIYNTPACHDEIIRYGQFSMIGDYANVGPKRIYVYSNAY